MTINTALGIFTLTARVDRIDIRDDGTSAIIDYKSAGTYTKSEIEDGRKPQLSLEAVIAAADGFKAEDVRLNSPGFLGYWKMTGGSKEFEEISIEAAKVTQAMKAAQEGLVGLVECFLAPDTPWLARPDPRNLPRFDDYSHLARVQEWAAADDDAGAEAAA